MPSNPNSTPQSGPMMRADQRLVEQGLAPSRSQARQWILEGRILGPDHQAIQRPAQLVPPQAVLSRTGPPPFVGRGGQKLEAFLCEYPLALEGRYALDVGASTGGFTECLLRRGIAGVVCLDVGHGQLHPSLASDPRVTNLEGINARFLQPNDLPRQSFDLIVVDLSFISLQCVLPTVWGLLAEEGRLITLVKPQFEVGPEASRAAGGVIRDPDLHQQVLDTIRAFAADHLKGSQWLGQMPSPILGGSGNREFLMAWQRNQASEQ